MRPDILRDFATITGLPKQYILHCCSRLVIEDETILHFYMHYGRFPTSKEAQFIFDIGLPNFNFLKSEGL